MIAVIIHWQQVQAFIFYRAQLDNSGLIYIYESDNIPVVKFFFIPNNIPPLARPLSLVRMAGTHLSTKSLNLTSTASSFASRSVSDRMKI